MKNLELNTNFSLECFEKVENILKLPPRHNNLTSRSHANINFEPRILLQFRNSNIIIAQNSFRERRCHILQQRSSKNYQDLSLQGFEFQGLNLVNNK